MRKTTLATLMFFFTTLNINAQTFSFKPSEMVAFQEQLVKSILWENYWKGHWSKRDFWEREQIDVLLKKKTFKAMVYPRSVKADMLVLDVYIDELRSVLTFSKDGDLFYLLNVGDIWSGDSAPEYFYEKKECEGKSKFYDIKIKDEYFDILKPLPLTDDKCNEIVKLFSERVLTKTNLDFIKKNIKNKSVKKLDIKVACFWNDYPYIYYEINNFPYCGLIEVNPKTKKVLYDRLFYWKTDADKKHYGNLMNRVEKEGQEFVVSNGKMNCIKE